MSKKISQLDELNTVLDTDIFAVVNNGATKKVTKQNILKEIVSALADKAAVSHDHDNRYYTESEMATFLTGKANLSHTHLSAHITDLTESVQDILGSSVVGGTNVTVSYDDATGQLVISSTGGGGGGGGSGDVVGASSVTSNAFAAYDGTTGKLLKNSTLLRDSSDNLHVGGLTSTPAKLNLIVGAGDILKVQDYDGTSNPPIRIDSYARNIQFNTVHNDQTLRMRTAVGANIGISPVYSDGFHFSFGVASGAMTDPLTTVMKIYATNGAYTAGDTFISYTTGARLAVGWSGAHPSAKFHLRGEGISSNTSSLLIQNSSGGELFRVRDDGSVGIGTAAPTAYLDINSDIIRLRNAKTPATSGATGNQGDIAWDSNYLYVATATNSWKRISLTTF